MDVKRGQGADEDEYELMKMKTILRNDIECSHFFMNQTLES